MSCTYSATCASFLHAACNGDISLLEKAVAEFGDVGYGSFANISDEKGATALQIAAEAGNTHICKYLINKLKFDVNDQDNDGYNALHYAVLENHLQTALYLLENGASISKTNNVGCIPLHVATWKGDKDMMQLLLSRGSDIEAKSDGGTPLTVAAHLGVEEAVDFLLQNKANVNKLNDSEKSINKPAGSS